VAPWNLSKSTPPSRLPTETPRQHTHTHSVWDFMSYFLTYLTLLSPLLKAFSTEWEMTARFQKWQHDYRLSVQPGESDKGGRRGDTKRMRISIYIHYMILQIIKDYTESWKCVIHIVCVQIWKGMQSNTTMSITVYLMAILDNYMFRPLLAIFRLSSRELKVLLYTLCVHVVQRSLCTGLIA